jgi:hypothetical protein
VLDNLKPQIRRRCLRFLYDICGRDALLPRSLTLPFSYDTTEHPLTHGGFADVWKGQYQGREVAVKVLKVYEIDDLDETRKVSCPRLVVCINKPTVSDTEVLRGGCGMEGPPSSQRVTAIRRDDDRESVRDGIRLDGKW